MGRGREHRAAAAAARAAEEEALRHGIDEVLRVKEEGDLERAANLAVKLVGAHPKSAAPYNLVGFVMECAADNLQDQLDTFPAQSPSLVGSGDAANEEILEEDRARRAKERAAAVAKLAVYLKTCAQWYSTAAELAPRCIFTRASYARSLGLDQQTAEAHHEFNSALRILNPDIPNRHNPWLKSTSQMATDDEQKRWAISKAQTDFHRFLHLADQRIYMVCKELLLNIHSGQASSTVSAKRKATELAAKYPFSARAALIEPFLRRQLIEASTSSVPKLKQYQQLIHDIVACVDMFPNSLVISLFRAEVLFTMGRYLEASMECLRGLRITKPDDPVSQDLPPVSMIGRRARTETLMGKLMELLEQTEENLLEPDKIEKLLQALCMKSKDTYIAHNRIRRLTDCLNTKLLSLDVPENSKPAKLKGNTSKKLSKKPKKKVLPKRHNANEETSVEKEIEEEEEEPVRPEQVIGAKVVPRQIVDTYAEYCKLGLMCPRKRVICHLCVFEGQEYYTNEIKHGDMIYHCHKKHQNASTIECCVYTCSVRFRSEEDQQLHNHYFHLMDKDWWKQWLVGDVVDALA